MGRVLKPFFTFYGGKYRAAPYYPSPRHTSIIEPFAGSAGYAVRYHDRKVILYDIDPVIVGVWSYLIATPAAEIERLPLLEAGRSVDDLPIPQEARWLIGFWLNKGSAGPCKTPSAWMRGGTRPNSYWGPVIRERIASQVDAIRHWKIEHASWNDIPNREGSWFVDPPYAGAGKHYRHSDVDFAALAEWCRTRRGMVVVCENEGADWLPFTPFMRAKANPSKNGGKTSAEAIWTNIDRYSDV
jgi:site-specific DNA-adenine methylase